jgi:hypothetical protein
MQTDLLQAIWPEGVELYQIGSGYAVLRSLRSLSRVELRCSFDLRSRVLTAVVDAPKLSEDDIASRLVGVLPRRCDRLVLTRKRPKKIACDAAAPLAASLRPLLAIAPGPTPAEKEVARDIGGALFQACASMADDEVMFVFTDCLREARRHLLALGGSRIEDIEDQPCSQRRPALLDTAPDIAS